MDIWRLAPGLCTGSMPSNFSGNRVKETYAGFFRIYTGSLSLAAHLIRNKFPCSEYLKSMYVWVIEHFFRIKNFL